ncbi:MAG TPA: 2-oxo acid dehydrogenase subunit E2, partial [Armatimonadota bacterium]|nr:2-oxo acid dehydrogenase subunit E2 [Armatimonadota bacterium]
VKAAALAILDCPIVNSSLTEDSIVIHDQVNIGVAAAVEDGLVVPVIRDADRKPLQQISEELQTLAAKARAGSLSLDEMQGGTFTVSNLASYGIDSFNPIINPPQSAILGVCRTVQKPVIIDGQVQVRSMMNLCLSFDHRVMDGAPAAEYLARLKQILEAPCLVLV